MTSFGALSIAPPVLAIVLAVITRKAVLSLFLGIWSGAVIVTGGLGIVQTFEWIVAAVSDEFQATILVFTLLLGSGVAMVWNLGGTAAVRDWALERLDSQRQAGLVYLLSEFDAARRGIDSVSVSEPQTDDGERVVVAGSEQND